MPPLRLTKLLQTACPDASPTTRAILSTLGCRDGDGPHADEVAAWVGLRDRHQVHRWLRRDGLPPLKRLAGWARVLYWLLEAEASHASLLQLAQRDAIDVATAYRLVVRVTGKRWSELRRAGLDVAVSHFQTALGHIGPQATRPAARAHQIAPSPQPLPAPSAPPRASVHHPAGTPTERVHVDGYPYDVAVDRSGAVYVTRLHAAALECLRLSPLRVTASIATGPAPTRVLLDPRDARAYVINQFSEDVAVVDLAQGRVVDRVPVPGNPLFAELSVNGRVLYVVTNTDRMCAITLPQGHVAASAPLARAGYGLSIHPSGRWLYTPTFRGGAVLELDARTLATTRRFPTGGVTQECLVSGDGLTLYSANEAGWLDAIHLPSGRQLARIHFTVGAVSLAQSPDEAELYVGLRTAGQVARLERATLRVEGLIETGGWPRRIAFDPSGQSALIANQSGWVDLVR